MGVLQIEHCELSHTCGWGVEQFQRRLESVVGCTFQPGFVFLLCNTDNAIMPKLAPAQNKRNEQSHCIRLK
jgi:hypothetical protein